MQDFTNTTIDLDTLPKYEEVVFEKLQPKYWNVIVINLMIFTLIVLGAVAITFISVYTSNESNLGAGFYIAILVAALLIISVSFWMNRISFKKKGFVIREKDLLYRSGVLSTTTTIVPFNRIQHIAVNEGVFSRMYSLASIEIYTAGGSTSDLNISGIDKEKAHSIREFLMNNVVEEQLISFENTLISENTENQEEGQNDSVESFENPKENE